MHYNFFKKFGHFLVFLMIVFCFGIVFKAIDVDAATWQDGGSGGQNVKVVTCNTAKYIRNIEQCGNQYGGASWHIFMTDKGSGKPTKEIKTYKRGSAHPVYNNKGILSGSFDAANFKCTKKNGYTFYIAYVYDGWNGWTNGSRKGPVFWGPIAWNNVWGKQGSRKNYPVYHTRKAYSYTQIKKSAKNGENVNGWRIQGSNPKNRDDSSSVSKEAAKFYRDYLKQRYKDKHPSWSNKKALSEAKAKIKEYKKKWNSGGIKKGIGYFCWSPSSTVELSAKAVVETYNCKTKKYEYGGMLNSGTVFDSDEDLSGEKHEVDRRELKDDKGYTFVGWRTSKKSGTPSGGDVYKESISSNKTVYAVYREKPDCPEACKTWAPSSYYASTSMSGTTSVVSKVKNMALNDKTYKDDFVYAKPNDHVGWRHCYFPGVQKLANTETSTNHRPSNNPGAKETWNNCDRLLSYCSNTYDSSYELKYTKFKSGYWGAWQNKFSVARNFYPALDGASFSADPGETDIREFVDETYSVDIGQEGNTLRETNTSGTPIEATATDEGAHSWKCKWRKQGDESYDTGVCKTWSEVTEDNPVSTCVENYWSTRPVYGWDDTCSHSGSFKGHTIKNTTANDYADVRVPYNFTNRTAVNNTNNGGVAYAGEEKTTYFDVATLPKDNNVTEGVGESSYATKSPYTQYRLKVCYGRNIGGSSSGDDDAEEIVSECVSENDDVDSDTETPCANTSNDDETENEEEIEFDGDFDDDSGGVGNDTSEEGIKSALSNYDDDPGVDYSDVGQCFYTTPTSPEVLNPSSKLEGDVAFDRRITFNVPDITAGSDVCVRSGVYPASSGADTNYLDQQGDHQWAYSPTQFCYTVAKKPSLQVWGGNTYVKGNIGTSQSVKGNLYGYNTYDPSGYYTKRYFGSWTELGLVASGVVTGFGSGASLGYQSIDNNGNTWPAFHPANGLGNNASVGFGGPGGTTDSSFCMRSPLTFANYTSCNSGSAGLIGVSTGTNQATEDKNAVKARLIPDTKPVAVSSANLDSNDTYYYSIGDMDINGGTLGVAGIMKVVHAKGNIYINGDISYGNDGYTTLTEIPKLVIYAEKNVNIACQVSRIDALIMADKQVRTCSNSDDIDDQMHSNQLVVNGAIISNSLDPKRTYGSASGANSIIPAEIINFDPTLYMWAGSGDNDDTASGGLNSYYMREVSPRL